MRFLNDNVLYKFTLTFTQTDRVSAFVSQKFLTRTGGVVDRVTIFLSASVITVVAKFGCCVTYCVGVCRRSKKLGQWSLAPRGMGTCLISRNTPPHMCYQGEIGRSKSDGYEHTYRYLLEKLAFQDHSGSSQVTRLIRYL